MNENETRKEQLYRIMKADAEKQGATPVPTFEEMQHSGFFNALYHLVLLVLAEEHEAIASKVESLVQHAPFRDKESVARQNSNEVLIRVALMIRGET